MADDLSMADDLAAAVPAGRRHGVDRALEAIERMPLPLHHEFERSVVVVAADLASCRGYLQIRLLRRPLCARTAMLTSCRPMRENRAPTRWPARLLAMPAPN
jgi:hypothetical protein